MPVGKQHPRGVIVFQGDYGPVAFRNLRVRPWKGGGSESKLNVPPEGFTALFNGKDFTGWRVHPKVKEMWSIEDGVLKSHGLLKEWGADLATEKSYRDFVLMLEFRMPTISDSGINFRRLIPEIPGFGNQEQFNLRSKGGMGHLESYYFLPKQTAQRMGLKDGEKPNVRHIDPHEARGIFENLSQVFNLQVRLHRTLPITMKNPYHDITSTISLRLNLFPKNSFLTQ